MVPDLYFNVSWIINKFFYDYSVIPEAGSSFLSREFEAFLCLVVIPGYTHAFAPTSSRCFDHHGVAYVTRDPHTGVCILHDAVKTWKLCSYQHTEIVILRYVELDNAKLQMYNFTAFQIREQIMLNT